MLQCRSGGLGFERGLGGLGHERGSTWVWDVNGAPHGARRSGV